MQSIEHRTQCPNCRAKCLIAHIRSISYSITGNSYIYYLLVKGGLYEDITKGMKPEEAKNIQCLHVRYYIYNYRVGWLKSAWS